MYYQYMTTSRKIITEAEAERIADRMVANRLQSSSSYRNAASAEAQAAAEDRSAAEVWRDLQARYVID